MPSVARSLRPDGVVCSFSPCIEQVQQTCEALEEYGFGDTRTAWEKRGMGNGGLGVSCAGFTVNHRRRVLPPSPQKIKFKHKLALKATANTMMLDDGCLRPLNPHPTQINVVYVNTPQARSF